MSSRVDELCVNTLRMLAVDAVEQARSGHPGMPLGAAPMAYVLWAKILRHHPGRPEWPDRDRFVLSAGHGSALLYALLHLSGYELAREEIEAFRQWGSKTPGHPERGNTVGVECTTGPLGQGFAMGVGMALAERVLAARYNAPGLALVDHRTYVLASDGDLMEGVCAEAASLAGHLGLGRLICLYDSNSVSIEGDTALTFTEDVGRRFEAYGWQVLVVKDGNDLVEIEAALVAARAEDKRPTLVVVRTHLGYGSPKQDSASSHGEPLGAEALRATKEHFGWPPDEVFHVPEETQAFSRRARERGEGWVAEWEERLEAYRRRFPEQAEEFEGRLSGDLPQGWEADLPVFGPAEGPLATREASGQALNALARRLPRLLGGSADLGPSNKSLIEGASDLSAEDYTGRNLHFGVREHAMGAVVNGLALHGGFLPYSATFLMFADYMRPALRLAALMGTPSLFIFSHDSLAVGEDGPTHQPVEQVASLRLIPGFTVIRPADANETAAAWRLAVARAKPTALILTRQKLPVLDPQAHPVSEWPERGAYVLAGAGEACDMILIATGSEVHLVLAAREKLAARGVKARVVSMPSWEIFD